MSVSVLDQIRCTILNASYEPLAVVSSKRGLILVIEGKAHIASEHPDYTVSSAKDVWPVPTQIVLNQFVKSRSTYRVPAILTQRNLFIRDGHRCGYCARHKSELKSGEFLTRDHIHPQSKGGKDEWKNVITACSTCNNKKADFLLDEIGMQLNKVPTIPTIFELWARAKTKGRKNDPA